jgi:hypothetical protein
MLISVSYLMDHLGAIAQLITAVVLAFQYLQTRSNGKNIKIAADDIRKVELATNSMKDQLVRVTGEAKYAEGIKHGEEYAKRVTPPDDKG